MIMYYFRIMVQDGESIVNGNAFGAVFNEILLICIAYRIEVNFVIRLYSPFLCTEFLESGISRIPLRYVVNKATNASST